MKNNILIFCLLALICIGCGHDERGKLTQRGKEITDSWDFATKEILNHAVLPVFQINRWIDGNDSVRRAIEDQYFTYQKIRYDGDGIYGVYYGANRLYAINTQGASLSDNGADWIITTLQPYRADPYLIAIPEFAISRDSCSLHIRNAGNGFWNIELDTASFYGSTSNLRISFPNGIEWSDFSDAQYALEGNGCYAFKGSSNEEIFLHYQIDETLSRGTSWWEAGTLTLCASTAGEDDINVKTIFLGNNSFRITYRDITETWN